MSDDLVKRIDSLMVLLDMERKKSFLLGKHIVKLEAGLKAVIHHCVDGYSSFSDIRATTRKALEGKDD